MFTRLQFNSVTRPFSRRQSQRGQSIVVALLVLLLLGLAGALFVTIVARNLINANKSNRVQTADQYASAGITYADSQLSSSIDGADWRPPLQFAVSDGTNGTPDDRPGTGPAGPAYPNGSVVSMGDSRGRKRYKSQVYDPMNNPNGPLKSVNATDPDAEYLLAGYARYNTGAGRYLVRVTYNPVNLVSDPANTANNYVSTTGLAVPPGKYLKIESIGREGNIDPMDPTTYGNNRSSDRTQSYLVAYKPIGITDYARFETNPDKRSDIANLGVVSQYNMTEPDGEIVTPGVYDFDQQGNTGGSGASSTVPAIRQYPILTTYGAADAYIGNPPTQPNPTAGTLTTIPTATGPTGFTPGGGSIHSNMSLRFFGKNVIYLDPIAAGSPLFQDTAEIGGDLLLNSYDPNVNLDNTAMTGKTPTTYQAASLILNPTTLSPAAGSTTPLEDYVEPSNSGVFDTHTGLIRDGSMQNDAAGLPRSITRLEPPLVDAQDNASQMPRYRAIAMNSAPRTYTNPTGTAATYPAGSAQYGYGKAIYVNNPNDIQQDSVAIGGGSTLTDEWLHRTAANSTDTNKGGWNGLFYNPPGVTIVLGQEITPPANTNTAGVYGIRLTRTDQFANPDGTPNGSAEMNVPYSDLDTDPTGAASDNDIVIYAEGNVRVRGIASPNEGTDNTTHQKYIPRHVTIVTGGTAYIEGNLLKGNPDSSISVLAHDYVCINTTQFLAGAVQSDLPQIPVDNPSVPLTDGYVFAQQFGFGFSGPATPPAPTTPPTPQTPTTQYGGKLALYVSGNTPNGLAQADFNILDATGNTVFNTATSNTAFNSSTGFPMPTFGALTHLTFDLSNTTLASLTGATGDSTFQLTAQKDPGNIPADTTNNLPGSNPAAQQNPLLERVAVLPMDIRIEAVLYAQTGSFFVIPGDWFNRDASDNVATYLSSMTRPNLAADIAADLATRGLTPGTTAYTMAYATAYTNMSRFPMYGQPIDLKITIDGSVSEAHPADIAAQTAWMQHWGWIPQYHGSLVTSSSASGGASATAVETAGHILAGQPAIGLQIIYDSQAGYPYDPAPTGTNNATPYYLRSDAYGRPLPFTPKLPVSTGLLYSGQSGEAPLLQ